MVWTSWLQRIFIIILRFFYSLPHGSDGKVSAYNVGDLSLIPGSGRSFGEGSGNSFQYSHLEKSHGWRSLVGYSPWGHKESDTTERLHFTFSSVQFSPQLCPTLCNPMDYSTPGFPVHHQLPEIIQTQDHWVSDVIQPSHPLSSPFPSTFNLSQHWGLFKLISSMHQEAKVLEFQYQHESFQWVVRTDFL